MAIEKTSLASSSPLNDLLELDLEINVVKLSTSIILKTPTHLRVGLEVRIK